MSVVLERDWMARMAARWGGRLYTATLTKHVAGAYSDSDPSGAPATTDTDYTCSAIALGYDARYLANERLKKGDYRVMVLRGTIVDGALAPAAVIPEPGDTIMIPPPGGSVAVAGRVVAADALTEAFATVHVKGSLA